MAAIILNIRGLRQAELGLLSNLESHCVSSVLLGVLENLLSHGFM